MNLVSLQLREHKAMGVREKSWQGRMGGLEQKETRMTKKNAQRGDLPPITLDGENSVVSFSAIYLYLSPGFDYNSCWSTDSLTPEGMIECTLHLIPYSTWERLTWTPMMTGQGAPKTS